MVRKEKKLIENKNKTDKKEKNKKKKQQAKALKEQKKYERMRKKRDKLRSEKRIIEKMYDEDQHINKLKSSDLTISITGGCILTYFAAYTVSIMQEEGTGIFESISETIGRITSGEYSFPLSIISIIYGLIIGGVLGVIIYIYRYLSFNDKYAHERDSIAGTGGFMKKKQKKKYKLIYEENEKLDVYVDPGTGEIRKDINLNMIFGIDTYRSLNPKVSNRNNNILIIGAPGTGKSFKYMKPNILQMNASFVITDPKGELLADTGSMLAKNGYKIKIFNLVDMRYSNTYNPFDYIQKDEDLPTMVDCFISNTTKEGEGKGEKFWTDSEALLYSACICYLKYEQKDKSKMNFGEVLKMINSSRNSEDGKEQEDSDLDKAFKDLPDDSRAKQYYTGFKQSPSRTRMGIVISCIARLQPFMIKSVVNLTSSDNIELGKIGDEKTALYIITPEGDSSPYNFLASMMYTQLFETLYYRGKQKKAATGSERMTYPVRCMMDEFPNIGTIPGFTAKLSTMRGYNIGAEIVIQSMSQLENRYKEDWETIVGDCDGILYLGTNEQKTNEYISKLLGNKTVIEKSKNKTKGSKGNLSEGIKATKREVLTTDELARMSDNNAILFTRGERPIFMEKYPGTRHPRWAESVAETFKYTDNDIYDNEKIDTDTAAALLKSKQEYARFRAKMEISDATDPNIVKELDINKILNQTVFSEDTQETMYSILVGEAISKVTEGMGDYNVVTVNVLENVAPKMLKEIATQTMYVLNLDNLILFADNHGANNDDKMIGVGVSDGDNGFADKICNDLVINSKRLKGSVFLMIRRNTYEDYVRKVNKRSSSA